MEQPSTIRPPFLASPSPCSPTTRDDLLKAMLVDLCEYAQAPRHSGEVFRIYDGDCLKIHAKDSDIRIRLLGLDNPEISHPRRGFEQGSLEAREALARLALHMPVAVFTSPIAPEFDSYGRTVALLFRLPDMLCINVELIRQGFAWPWPFYNHPWVGAFNAAAAFARTHALGLYSFPQFTRSARSAAP